MFLTYIMTLSELLHQYSVPPRHLVQDVELSFPQSSVVQCRPAPGLFCLHQPHRRPPNGKDYVRKSGKFVPNISRKSVAINLILLPSSIGNQCSPCSSVLWPVRPRLCVARLSPLSPVALSPPTPPPRTPRTSRRFVEISSGK